MSNEQELNAKILLVKKMTEFCNKICEDIDVVWGDNCAINMAEAALAVLKGMDDTYKHIKEQGI